MGVPALNDLLKECPEAVEHITDDELSQRFKGQTFLFDTSGMMHRFVNKCDTIANNEHLDCFIKLWQRLNALGIVSAFVFDGKNTVAKQDEIQKRIKSKQRSMEQAKKKVDEYQQEIKTLEERVSFSAAAPCSEPTMPLELQTPLETTTQQPPPIEETAVDFSEMIRLAMLKGKLAEEEKKATRKVHSSYYVQLKQLFREHGVPFMTATYEAEQAGSWLVKHGFANVMVSDDYDCLLCGAPAFFQHFHSNKKNCTQRLVKMEPLLKHLGFTHDQFVDFCILAGTDFGGHLPGIGAKSARRIIEKHKDIDTYLASSAATKYRDNTNFNHKLARRMFADDGTFPLASVEIPAMHGGFGRIQERFDREQEQNPLRALRKSAEKKVIRSASNDRHTEKRALRKSPTLVDALPMGEKGSSPKRARIINL